MQALSGRQTWRKARECRSVMMTREECEAICDAINDQLGLANLAIQMDRWEDALLHLSNLESYASSIGVWAEELPAEFRPRMRLIAGRVKEQAMRKRWEIEDYLGIDTGECDVDRKTLLDLLAIYCLVCGIAMTLVVLAALR